MKRLLVMVGVGAAMAACGGGGSGGGGGGGAGGGGGVGGTAGTQIAYVVPALSCGSGTSYAGIEVLLSSNRVIADACTHASDPCVSYANISGIALFIMNFDVAGGTAGAVTPGTYDVGIPPTGPTGTLASVVVDQTDASCKSTLTGQENATGTITVTAVNGTSVTGSYDVTAYGNHYAGSFDAGVCSSGTFQGDVCQPGGGVCQGTEQCL